MPYPSLPLLYLPTPILPSFLVINPLRFTSSGLAFAVDQVRQDESKHNDLSHLLEFQTPIVQSFLGVTPLKIKEFLEIQIRILIERITIAT